jgi:hypothetical protein
VLTPAYKHAFKSLNEFDLAIILEHLLMLYGITDEQAKLNLMRRVFRSMIFQCLEMICWRKIKMVAWMGGD